MAKRPVEELKTIRSNFSMGLYAFCLLHRLKKEDLPHRDRVVVGEDGLYCVPPGETPPTEAGDFYDVGFAGSPSFNIDKAAMEFAKMLVRNFTLDYFESLKAYCRETDQQSKLKSQPWYQFVRMMRNSLTHDRHWRFNPHDKTLLPVSWRGKTIAISMDGDEPDFEFYDWWDACELWEAMNTFAAGLD